MYRFSVLISILVTSLIVFGNAFGQTNNISNITSESNNNAARESDDEIPIPNLVIVTGLSEDPDAFSYQNGKVYKVDAPFGIYVDMNGGNESDAKFFPILNDPNRIDFSENSISVNFAFKVPINNITSTIERIDSRFTVLSISNYPNQTDYASFADYPIFINDTEYRPMLFFSIPNEGAPFMNIENYPP
ncbi:hypothetical protein [Candidatus Nitrosocosmicus sp. FF01]|uniref:hypothetical protein n=1 Tax=Candidatus Nitrosocosmicus sp. FF01 TaxID=3397670 RepID=UPI0039E78181